MSYDIGFLLDALILIFLSVTIFYAARLSLFLKSFREGKDGMQLLIRDLSNTVDKAEASINTMKANAKETEAGLREIVKEATFLSDELRFMNETGDSLAGRLEKLADRNRELVELIENSGGIGHQKTPQAPKTKPVSDPWVANQSAKNALRHKINEEYEVEEFEINDFDVDEDDEYDFMALGDGAYREEESHKPRVNTQSKRKVRSFAIFDKDHEEAEEENSPPELSAKNSQNNKSQFHSQAEQDLYEALQRRKKSAGRVSEIT